MSNVAVIAAITVSTMIVATSVHAGDVEPVPLTITTAGLRNSNGTLKIAVFDKADGFPGKAKQGVHAASLKLKELQTSGRVMHQIKLPPGKYAVAVLHDENDNGTIDFHWYGAPAEGYGVSNNPAPTWSAPTYEASEFELPNKPTTITIEMRY